MKKKVSQSEILKDTISVLEYTGRSNKRFIGGVDPDVKKPGFAVWDQQLKEWAAYGSVAFEKLADSFSDFPKEDTTIYVEAGWMNKITNFHGVSGYAAKGIAMRVGQNHAASKIIASELRSLGFEVVDVKPLFKGRLKGKNGWTQQGREHIEQVTGITSRINDEVRDALYIVVNKTK
ncbi:MAG: hypothetical protein J7619_23065 [Dyadobacter sp.]|uniref:hypothetical protein n=1 Tax=Dyadobacter sp. TaxID=1914288 RepID=UPI001B1CC7E7|nr:hypothetical protein [Dyadobacter sp.]MBO9615596.1 hypothetical protein [Dyadobacter sp.]